MSLTSFLFFYFLFIYILLLLFFFGGGGGVVCLIRPLHTRRKDFEGRFKLMLPIIPTHLPDTGHICPTQSYPGRGEVGGGGGGGGRIRTSSLLSPGPAAY